jgi:small-conductance mechanosensitive channel
MFKNLKLMAAALFAMIAAMSMQVAHAALDTAVATEIATAKTDVITLGGLVFGIAVAIVLYKWFKRAL